MIEPDDSPEVRGPYTRWKEANPLPPDKMTVEGLLVEILNELRRITGPARVSSKCVHAYTSGSHVCIRCGEPPF